MSFFCNTISIDTEHFYGSSIPPESGDTTLSKNDGGDDGKFKQAKELKKSCLLMYAEFE